MHLYCPNCKESHRFLVYRTEGKKRILKCDKCRITIEETEDMI